MGQLANKGKRRNFRMRLWKKQAGGCFYCRCRVISPDDGTLDHVIPRSRGGPDSPRNLVFACKPCNARKADAVYRKMIPMKTTELMADIAISRLCGSDEPIEEKEDSK
jgi:5-methylcytosine-specific restriction endonuclease McrA